MDKRQILTALALLDKKLKKPVRLLLGGGGAMLLAHGFPVATQDLDAMVYKSTITHKDIFSEIQQTARELSLPKDWLNSYFETFLYSLPKDYDKRLITVFSGKKLAVDALGREDLLIMKCCSGREKDIVHARSLIKKGANIELVQNHLRSLVDLNIPKMQQACDFLDDLVDELC